jgi:ABC-type branched-subunit amino acid transport system ATPase component
MNKPIAASRLSSTGAYALELEGVGRQFGALVAMADISMKVAAGERRAVLGSNGAGKTTLFNTITGDFLPSSGTIRFFGEDITDFPAQERIRRGLRRTYQISQLFGSLSVLQNVFSPAAACRVDDSQCCVRPGTMPQWRRLSAFFTRCIWMICASGWFQFSATVSNASSKSP